MYLTNDNGNLELFQEDCNAQEQEYIVKSQAWDTAKVRDELERLESLDQSAVDKELASWIRRRIRILNQFVSLRETNQGEQADDNQHDEL